MFSKQQLDISQMTKVLYASAQALTRSGKWKKGRRSVQEPRAKWATKGRRRSEMTGILRMNGRTRRPTARASDATVVESVANTAAVNDDIKTPK